MPRNLSPLLILALLAVPVAAGAEEQDQEQSSEAALPRLGQAPGEPQVRSAPPSIPFGIPPAQSAENVLDFHGYMLLPLRIGVLKRRHPLEGQSATTLHMPPLVPQYERSFNYTGVLPDPWIQMNFTYGNSTVSGTAIIAARATTDGSGVYIPTDQLGVYDAFVTVNLSKPFKTPVQVKIGAITGRYGVMGAFDAGRYGTPLIARTNSVGEMITAALDLGPTTKLLIEQGFGGQVARPPVGLIPAGWNDFADPNVGASFVNQIHAGISHANLVQLGLHYLTAWTQDDQGPSGQVPDGRISVYGADARLTAGRAGHLYGGIARTVAVNSEPVAGVIEVLNARGGPELISEYLGPDSGGDGSLTTFGAQYDLSVARLVYGKAYIGKSPDVLVSLFGIGTNVSSDDPAYDGVLKLKAGAQATYNIKSWLSASMRFDHVSPDVDNSRTAFNIYSPAILLHTDWQSRDEIALQYSHFVYGSEVPVRTGYPPVQDPTAVPDKDVFMLSGTFWW